MLIKTGSKAQDCQHWVPSQSFGCSFRSEEVTAGDSYLVVIIIPLLHISSARQKAKSMSVKRGIGAMPFSSAFL